MIVRIDARRFTSETELHRALNEALGFPSFYGNNMSALIDCLTSLDNPGAGMSRVQVFPGEVLLLVLENVDSLNRAQAAQTRALLDAVSYVNLRRLESSAPPVLAVAHEPFPDAH